MMHEEVVQARRYVQASQRLDGAAAVLRNLIRACVKDPTLSDKYGFGLSTQDVGDDLRLQCAHGQIRVVSDQVIRNGVLLGRFTFFLVKTDVLGDSRAETLHFILYNDSKLATLESDQFEWAFDGPISIGDEVTHNLLAALLVAVTRSIPRL